MNKKVLILGMVVVVLLLMLVAVKKNMSQKYSTNTPTTTEGSHQTLQTEVDGDLNSMDETMSDTGDDFDSSFLSNGELGL